VAQRRPLTLADIEKRLETDAAGKLYWDGKRVRTASWGAQEWSVIVALAAALSLAAANLDRIQANLFPPPTETPAE
jgi:hypothetical protein